MLALSTPVRRYMTSPVRSVPMDASADDVKGLLQTHPVSAFAVLDRAGMLRGVISRGDIISRSPADASDDPTSMRIADLMTTPALTIRSDAPLSAVARHMLEARVHRLFVTEGSEHELVGVVATPDLMRAVRDQDLATPIREVASTGVAFLSVDDSIETAMEVLGSTHGIVVLDAGWPIGVFDQMSALRARDLPSDAKLESVLNWAVLVVDEKLAVGRVAAQALATSAHRVVVMRRCQAWGVVNGFDFARFVA